jgi:uncharacterized repeat protein (TIGR01451 family)
MSIRIAVSLIAASLVLASTPAFAQVLLPWNEGFEGTSGETYTSDTASLTGAADWSYANTDPSGRLRTDAGAGYPRTGSAAITLDRSPSGSDQINYLTVGGDMSLYSVAVDTVVLDFAFMDHGEDVHASDRVWVRGSNTDAWLPIADLNALAGPVGLYEVVEDLNVSGLLASAGQDFTGTFEVRFGQEDDSPSTGISNGDGFTFDDFAMRLIGPDDVAASGVISPVAGECSSSAMMIGVEVTNFGGNVVSNVPVELTITDAAGNVSTVSGVAAGPLGFLDTATVTVGPVDLFVGGLTDFVVTSQLLGDTDPANDVYIETVDLALGAVPLDPIDGACPTYPTTLTVQAEGATVYTWWDAPTGGIQLGSGPAFTTPVIGSQTTYWVQRNTTTGSAGALDNTVGTGGYFPDYDDGLVFDVAVPSQLDSVLIYADAAGDLTINLEDDTGMEIDSMTIAVSTGANVVPVGFSLPVGTGFVMHAQGTTVPNLFRNTGGALFPYTTAGSEVTVTGNVNGLLDYYYYFYDWQVTAGGCADERTEVVVPVGIAECDTDLEVLVTSGPEIVPGASLVYTVDVTNHGPDPLAGYQLTSADPVELGTGTVAGACTSFPCDLIDIAPGTSTQVTVTYAPDPALPDLGPIEFTLLAVPTSGETDPEPTNDLGLLSLPVVAHADLTVDVTEEADPLIVGAVETFLVHVENAGPSVVDVTLHAQLPAEFTNVQTLLGCTNGMTALPACTLGPVTPGVPVEVMYQADVPIATIPGTVTSVWTVTTDAVEDVPGGETWAETTEIAIGADLELTMTVVAENVIAGAPVDVTLRTINHGPDPVLRATVHLELPDGVEAVTLPSGCDADLVCAVEPMVLGEYAEVVVPVRPAPDATGLLHLTATSRSERPDPVETNNIQDEEFEIHWASDLVVTATLPAGPIAAGDSIDLDVRVENVGPSNAVDVVVVLDLPPAGLTVEGCVEDQVFDTVCPLTASIAFGDDATTTISLVIANDALGTFSIPVSARSSGASVGDGATVVDVVVSTDTGEGCADCGNSVAGRSSGHAGLAFLLLLALRRRRK